MKSESNPKQRGAETCWRKGVKGIAGMDAEKLRIILKEEYGISSDAELDEAIEKFQGLNVGIFTVRKKDGQKSSVA